ncbi:MAG: hypothetical protein WC838_03290, partial [Candidatus Margulisiibacteriota bacterium]
KCQDKELLLQLALDDSALVASAGYKALSKFKLTEADCGILARSKSAKLRELAARNSHDADLLLGLLRDDNDSVSGYAGIHISNCELPESTCSQMASSNIAKIRKAAAESSHDKETLIRLAQDTNQFVEWAALERLESIALTGDDQRRLATSDTIDARIWVARRSQDRELLRDLILDHCSEVVQKAMSNLQRTGLTEKDYQVIAKAYHPEARLFCAKNCGEIGILSGLAADACHEVAYAATQNIKKRASKETDLKIMAKSQSGAVRALIAGKDPGKSLLLELIRDNDKEVRNAAENKLRQMKLTGTDLVAMVLSSSRTIRLLVIEQSQNKELLLQLITEENSDVAMSALNKLLQMDLQKADFKMLISIGAVVVREYFADNSKDIQILSVLAADAINEVACAAVNNLRNRTFNTAELNVLAKSPSSEVRKLVAEKSSDVEVLILLAADEDHKLAHIAQTKIASMELSEAELRIMAKCPVDTVRELAANKSRDKELLLKLAADSSHLVFYAAVNNTVISGYFQDQFMNEQMVGFEKNDGYYSLWVWAQPRLQAVVEDQAAIEWTGKSPVYCSLVGGKFAYISAPAKNKIFEIQEISIPLQRSVEPGKYINRDGFVLSPLMSSWADHVFNQVRNGMPVFADPVKMRDMYKKFTGETSGETRAKDQPIVYRHWGQHYLAALQPYDIKEAKLFGSGGSYKLFFFKANETIKNDYVIAEFDQPDRATFIIEKDKLGLLGDLSRMELFRTKPDGFIARIYHIEGEERTAEDHKKWKDKLLKLLGFKD